MSAKKNEVRLVARPWDPSMLNRQPEKEKEADWSLLAYVRHCLEGGDEGAPEQVYVSQFNLRKDVEIAKVGEYIPPRALGRALNIATDTAGGYLVEANVKADDFIFALGNVALANRHGVEVWPGQIGNLVVPTGTGAAVPYWLDTEGTAPEESPAVFGAVVCKPRTLGTLLPAINRNLLLLGTRKSTEPILQGMLRRAIASGIDKALFAGTGANGQPTGILNTPGIDSRSGANFSIETGAAMIRAIEDANIATEAAAWIASPDVAEILRKRPKVTGGEIMMTNDDNLMCARPLHVTSALPAGTLLLGNFSEGAAIPTWGPSVEILVDDKTRSKEGQVRIVAFASVDIFVRRTAAFALATGIS